MTPDPNPRRGTRPDEATATVPPADTPVITSEPNVGDDNDEFQALLRRLVHVDGRPRDEAAWGEFMGRFGPTIRYHSRISGGRVPLLQGIMDTHDLADSVWRRCLEQEWVERRLLGRSEPQVRAFFVEVSRNHWLKVIRGHGTQRRGAGRSVSLDAGTEAPDHSQPPPDEGSEAADFERWVDDRLRAMCQSDDEFARARQLIRGETTFTALAGGNPMLAKSYARWFEKLCGRLGDRIEYELRGPDPDVQPE
jgi:hypothetical protein